MNVGIVTTWFERGAAYVSRQFKDSLEKQFAVYIYARGGESRAIGNPDWDGPNVTWGKATNLPMVTAVDISDFEQWIRAQALDVVFFNEQHWWEPVISCKRLGVTVGSFVDYYTEETVPLFEIYDFLICNTRRHYEVFKWHPQCFYVPWGTDTDLFIPKTHEPVEKGITTFFHSAGYSPVRKGTDLALRAIDRIQREDIRLIIHSQCSLRQCLPQEAMIIDRLIQNGRLELIEKTQGAPGLYTLGDVYLGPSRLEGIGLPFAEALASGLPIITSDSPPMSEFINGGSVGCVAHVLRQVARSDGYYWPQVICDVDHLAHLISSYADLGTGIRELKYAARKFAETRLNWRHRTSQICGIFQNLVRAELPKERELLRRARQYDNIRGDLRLRVAQKSPFAYKALLLTSKLWRRVGQGPKARK